MKISRYKSYKLSTSMLTPIIYKNVMLSSGLALPFAIVCATNYKNALALTIAMLISVVPTMLIMSFVGKTRIPGPFKKCIMCLVSLGFVILSSFAVQYISLEIFDALGSYFFLLGINTITVVRAIDVAPKLTPITAVVDGLVSGVSFALVMFLTAIIRELLGSGSIFGKVLFKNFTISGMLLPFGGFIVVAFLGALFATLKRNYASAIFAKDQDDYLNAVNEEEGQK